MFLTQRYNSIIASSAYSRHDVYTANQSQRMIWRMWPTKNEHVRKPPTLLDNIKCWPTFWTHDELLLANTVGQHMLTNICLSCVRRAQTKTMAY